MTLITHPRRKSNLARMIDSAGGVSVGVALARARANIEAKRAEALTVVESEIAALEAVPAPVGPDDAPARLDEAYRAATGVIDAAGPFDLVDLCRTASSLCDLIGAARPGEAFDWRIVIVHARTMRLLQTLPLEAAEQRARVLHDLGRMVERKLAQAG
ncbi:chemotaxis protein CheE [Brevundimonas sp.]|uniref:chemotaxis protein CheE n=1 Tax=Brevundimonas sp. TaxID=1871086 RepID=UPI002737FD0F|nr:chemotaxis protein CheE [Brevundimonas sp.]MDP3801715.1 chemotaxis protein CheE [Brevundimonas sp.]